MDPDEPLGSDVDPARLQPGETFNQAVDEWLRDPDLAREAEHSQRLAADEDLVLELQLNNFSDAVWKPVAEEFAKYGIAVMRSWLAKGSIYGRLKQLTGYGLPRVEGWPDHDAVMMLANDTVVRALRYFKTEILAAGRWSGQRGATLSTFFIGQCLYSFPNVYRSAYGEEMTRRSHNLLLVDDIASVMAEDSSLTRGVEDLVVAQREAADALKEVTVPRARKAIFLAACGFDYEDIAKWVGLRDAKQVDNLVAYQRKRLRRLS